MAMAYIPFAPNIPYYPPPPKPGQSSRCITNSRGHHPAMTYSQRPSYPTGSAVYPVHTNWRVTQSCLFGPSFPAELYAALPTGGPQRYIPPFLPEGESSPLGTMATGTDFPPSPSDTCSSSEAGLSPSPDFVHAVCNAPLVAPVPLPYHSPTFLQFDLPDDDEDLSHPPYVSRPHKRKRSETEIEDPQLTAPSAVKRRLGVPAIPGNPAGHLGKTTSTRHPLRRWPDRSGASHGSGMPG